MEPRDPGVVFAEDFENGQGATPVLVTEYTGAAPVNQTYTADPAWLSSCNGWIVSRLGPEATPRAAGCGDWWPSVKKLAATLGEWAGGDPATNHAVAAYTHADPGAGKTQLETRTSVGVGAGSRFLAFSVDVAETNCHGHHAKLGFHLLDGSDAVPAFTTPIEPCARADSTVDGIAVGTYTSDAPVLFRGPKLGLRLVNFQPSGYGNDAAFDNVRVLDVTPRLQAAVKPRRVEAGAVSRLEFTIVNTSELAAKKGWSFTGELPAGLTMAGDAATTDCQDGKVTAPAGGGRIDVTGTLPEGAKSCTVTVPVTSARAGSYSVCAENLTAHTGVHPHGCARARFVPPALTFDVHAHGARVTGPLTAGPLAASDLVCTPLPGWHDASLAGTVLPVGAGSVKVVATSVAGTVDRAGRRTATGTAEVTQVSLLGGLVTADKVRSAATARGDGAGRVTATGEAEFANLRISGAPVDTTRVNLVIDVPKVASVTVNERVPYADGAGVAVNAIHIRTPAGTDTVIGHTRAALTHPGKPCPVL
ncbi:choice-of-anchor P family protein [Sphaerisporangium sp. TRM90804]|uniref:choice-of-anchor P family protein n=1 Tax=Sphaerisporangium sp. TRM90804 TaxID=3031113 RepID=UPI00244BCFD0|nr:choice-of-anchor P family protein [Sphaerisporangium sp. TRM90804]MDH2424962.1 choice-of-anchor P family protein [Sphaerisporangium sp. TRM90804]